MHLFLREFRAHLDDCKNILRQSSKVGFGFVEGASFRQEGRVTMTDPSQSGADEPNCVISTYTRRSLR
jgi:hypothetical protein